MSNGVAIGVIYFYRNSAKENVVHLGGIQELFNSSNWKVLLDSDLQATPLNSSPIKVSRSVRWHFWSQID